MTRVLRAKEDTLRTVLCECGVVVDGLLKLRPRNEVRCQRCLTRPAVVAADPAEDNKEVETSEPTPKRRATRRRRAP